jgi:hypothetical protein
MAAACSFGKARTRPAEATSQATASSAAVGLPRNPLRSFAIPDASARSGPAAPADTRKIPTTLTYMVRHRGHACRRTKNEAYAK